MNFHFHVFLSCVISRYANCVCSFVYFKHWQPYIYIYIKNCCVRLLSNYTIKYICNIYTRLDTCLMSISRFSLRDKVTLRLLKLFFCIANVVEWSRELDIMLSDWCCGASVVWVQIPSREEQKLDSSKI